MTCAETLRAELLTVEANEHFTEAVMRFRDNSRLCFCHRVGERWAKAVGPEEREDGAGLAALLLSTIKMFRLNAKHLDIQFEDDSRWDEALRNSLSILRTADLKSPRGGIPATTYGHDASVLLLP